jgi:CRP-like cAMP-binding protein
MLDGDFHRRDTCGRNGLMRVVVPPHAFVSCDIVGHSGESDLRVQHERVAAINRIVRVAIDALPPGHVVWASGGDGGHVAFTNVDFAGPAIDLIRALRAWSTADHVPLRVVASHGEAVALEGADGRVQLVGPGINLAGRLLELADERSIFATEAFTTAIQAEPAVNVVLHDSCVITLPYFGSQTLYLLSIPGEFDSIPTGPSSDEHAALGVALDEHDAFEALYRSKRLLQLNPRDQAAVAAIERLAGRRDLVRDDSEISWLILDPEFSAEFISAAELVERRRGDVVCRHGDPGTTMFLVVRGALAGSPDPEPQESEQPVAPTFGFAPGNLFGELAFLMGRRRTATIWCLQDSALLQFSYEKLARSAEPLRSQFENAVNRAARAHLAERVARTAPFLAGPGGPLEGRVAETATAIRRASELLSVSWPEYDTLTGASAAVHGEGLYVLVSGLLQQTGSGMEVNGEDEPLIFAELSGELSFREHEYLLGGDVRLLAIRPTALRQFGPGTYRQVIATLREHVGAASQSDGAAPSRSTTHERGRVFISYAHADERWLRQLTTHLQPLIDLDRLVVWDDRRIAPGANWLLEIQGALAGAGVAVLLVSPALLESDFVRREELPAILGSAEAGRLEVIWIPISYSAVGETPLCDYQAAHDPERPLDTLGPPARAKVLTEIARHIADAAGRA